MKIDFSAAIDVRLTNGPDELAYAAVIVAGLGVIATFAAVIVALVNPGRRDKRRAARIAVKTSKPTTGALLTVLLHNDSRYTQAEFVQAFLSLRSKTPLEDAEVLPTSLPIFFKFHEGTRGPLVDHRVSIPPGFERPLDLLLDMGPDLVEFRCASSSGCFVPESGIYDLALVLISQNVPAQRWIGELQLVSPPDQDGRGSASWTKELSEAGISSHGPFGDANG